MRIVKHSSKVSFTLAVTHFRWNFKLLTAASQMPPKWGDCSGMNFHCTYTRYRIERLGFGFSDPEGMLRALQALSWFLWNWNHGHFEWGVKQQWRHWLQVSGLHISFDHCRLDVQIQYQVWLFQREVVPSSVVWVFQHVGDRQCSHGW